MASRKTRNNAVNDSAKSISSRAATARARPTSDASATTTRAAHKATANPLAALEARIAALEAANSRQAEARSAQRTQDASKPRDDASALQSVTKLTADDDRYWALNELNRQRIAAPDDRGAVLYAGSVQLPSGVQYVWQRQDSTRELLEQDWCNLADTIAALAHPMRLEILKHALGQERSTQDFMALPDMGTTGQLFHHIKALQEAGWLRSLQRSLYGVPGERVVPLLAILAASRG
jgi:Helix-turn-helix domain